MKLIVGLGNPGKNYENTRHNIGFMAIENYAKKNNLTKPKEKNNGCYYEFNLGEEKIIMLKPLSFMNLSGEVVRKYVEFYKIDINDILIISDDLDMPLGKIKLKPTGSSGGHNGLKNIENNLKTKDYKRLKIGIANNKEMETKDYVLGKFSKTEQNIIDEAINITSYIIEDFINMNFDKVMNKYN